MEIKRYLEKLAAKSPVPGGGSAAALTGAIGMSLMSMAAGYTAKKVFAARRAGLSEIIGFAASSRRRLLELMAEDEKAYLRLSGALRKKGKKDTAAIAVFYKKAAAPPLEMCRVLNDGLKRCARLSAFCSKALASDLAEAAILMEAGFASARLNAEINLDGACDKAYAGRMRRWLDKKGALARKIKEKVKRGY